jgi:SAM-dependent methyltransferase
MNWGDTTTNNYGFAPTEGHQRERFQTQLYTELLNLLDDRLDFGRIARVLEISCGRGGSLGHLARHLPPQVQLIGLDFSAHAIAFCREHYAAVVNLAFVRGHALQLPFEDGSFDLVVNIEASHAYGNDAAFLREVRRALDPRAGFCLPIIGLAGKFLYWSGWPAPPALPGNCAISRAMWSAPASSTRSGAEGSSALVCLGTLACCSPAASRATRGCPERLTSSVSAAAIECTS